MEHGIIFLRDFFGFFLLQWQMVYCFRSQGSSHRRLVCNDYFYIFIVSFFLATTLIISSGFFSVVLFVALIFIFILQWLNIILLRFYGIKLNFHMVKTASTGIGHFTDEAAVIIPELAKDIKLAVFPIFALLVYIGYFFLPITQSCYFYAAFFIYFMAVLTKSKVDHRSMYAWLLLILLAILFAKFFQPLIIWLNNDAIQMTGAIVIMAGILLLLFMKYVKRHNESAFYSLPTMLIQQFSDDAIPLTILEQPPMLQPHDQVLSQSIPRAAESSQQHGACAKASVILITMESLSGYYFRDANLRKTYLPFFSRLETQAMKSKCHISPSSLTNNMLKIIYGGGYQKQQFPHMDYLRDAGYQTFFLTSAKASEFNMDKLLKQIGFSTVIDNVLISEKKNQRMPDNIYFEKALDKLVTTLDPKKPFFLHLMNNQTHGPYFTYQKKVHDRKERYFQAVLEADQTFEKFITQLKSRLNLENLIIIYAGDHGESFGEEGYTSHANSIIQPQIEVPFLLTHPKLTTSSVPMSNHFDIFPTIFDLLGMPCSYETLGNSLYHPDPNPHTLVYSETRMGNTPSSFGLIIPQQKIYFDRHMENYQRRDLNDKVIEELSGEQYDYYLKLLLTALQNAQLLS